MNVCVCVCVCVCVRQCNSDNSVHAPNVASLQANWHEDKVGNFMDSPLLKVHMRHHSESEALPGPATKKVGVGVGVGVGVSVCGCRCPCGCGFG